MDHLAAIRRDSDRFYAIADVADPDRTVPSCPDWTIADLVWHLADCHRFWATDIERRASDPAELADATERPAEYPALVADGRDQAERLLAALESTPAETTVWTWALDPALRTVGFIGRHQVQETAVHRWDIERAATGAAEPIDAEVAADAIDEALTTTLPFGVDAERPLPGTVHLHCTDVEGEWFVHPDGRVEPIHAKGTVAIRGTASDLLLALYSRIALGDVDVIGDEALAAELLARLDTA